MQERTGKAALVRGEGSSLLDRILETPQLARVVPRLPPELLHRVIDRYGLEACGALMALATPAQVGGVLDLDLWRSPAPGLDPGFDAERFGVWLEVLVDHGVETAARIVAGLDADLVAAGLAQHVRVFDIGTLEGYETTDGTAIPAVIERDGGLSCEIAGRRFLARRPDAWDAILDVLAELDTSHPRAFAGLMRRCLALSNSRSEIDGLDALLTGAEQAMFDLADAREERREATGFAAPAQARAFLESSRRLRLDAAAPPDAAGAPRVQVSATREAPAIDAASVASTSAADALSEATAAVIDLLCDAGLVDGPTRGLLGAGERGPGSGPASPFAGIHAHLRALSARDPIAGATQEAQLAMLANALVAGCTIDARPFTPREASDAVLATCNLGLECWPAPWPVADVVTIFQVGWTVLHDDVCVTAVSRLLGVLARLPAHDPETQAGLRDLRVELTRHWRAGTAWQAREALDVLASLDQLAWVTLLALVAECPVISATIDPGAAGALTVDPSAFTFISSRAQIRTVDAFLATLPDALGA